jgi:regulator of sigma E protease
MRVSKQVIKSSVDGTKIMKFDNMKVVLGKEILIERNGTQKP